MSKPRNSGGYRFVSRQRKRKLRRRGESVYFDLQTGFFIWRRVSMSTVRGRMSGGKSYQNIPRAVGVDIAKLGEHCVVVMVSDQADALILGKKDRRYLMGEEITGSDKRRDFDSLKHRVLHGTQTGRITDGKSSIEEKSK